ncbi:hypothetical protein F2Q68_00025946 [Brassica cretica]|uniref:Arabidopsis retrotransposon Orf1 C-terminal domain-containing protein n=1 Tax=Brassica cretica TaxID=69181 RepID=A0A8S9IHL3_BRACR|nr:hypothetical protein F2Q68_00025946 [Brassica cretica]
MASKLPLLREWMMVDNEDIIEEDQAPLKKAKMSKGKKVDTERDRTKKPTESELYGHLKNGVLWPPTRFTDIKIMEALEIDEDIKQMLENMNMQSFFSMAYPTYEEVSCQFLATLEATFHTSKHRLVLRIWRTYIPILYDATREESIARLVWKVLAGKNRKPSCDKNASICHLSVRYLHRLIVHTIFPRKEPGTVNDEELQLLHQTVQHYAPPSQLPLVGTDFYKNFGMVGFFVNRLIHYKKWAWTTSDSEPQIGIGGLITPLLGYKDISLGDDATGPTFLDASYLKKVQYFSGRFDGTCVYSYLQSTKEVQIGRNDQHKIEAKKQELAKQETARTWKPLTSVSTTGGTSRQQALAAKKRDGKQVATVEGMDASGRRPAPPKRSKEPKDKGVALPQVEENKDITGEDQAPLKKAKVSKGKKVDTERDRTKTPTESELYGHLKNGVLWPPTRFTDIKIMKELEIEVSCQFLASLEATFHTSKHVRQRWGKIKFKVHGKVHYMTFKEIGQALGLKDLEESSIPILYDTPREESIARMVWKVLAGKTRKPSRDKNASIRHPSVRYLHRLIVHTIFPRKEPGTVNDEEL